MFDDYYDGIVYVLWCVFGYFCSICGCFFWVEWCVGGFFVVYVGYCDGGVDWFDV